MPMSSSPDPDPVRLWVLIDDDLEWDDLLPPYPDDIGGGANSELP